MNSRGKPNYAHLTKDYHQQQNYQENNYRDIEQDQQPQYLNRPAKHWKSYLAPEIVNAQSHYQQDKYSSPSSRMKSISSLRSFDPMYEERKPNDEVDYDQYNEKKQVFNKRKQEIMNKIKLLQDQVVPTVNESSPDNEDDKTMQALESRVSALEQRVSQMPLEFQLKLKKEISELEKRLRRK